MYKAEGIFLFAHGENGELYQKQLNIVDLAIAFRKDPEEIQKLYAYDINEDDLIDGKEYLWAIRKRAIINRYGVLHHIFVDGFESNLGIANNDFYQGEFLVTEDCFEELCEKYDIKVHWKENKKVII